MTESVPAPESATQTLPVMPLRDVVLYPHMVSPLFVGREKSIQALDAAQRLYLRAVADWFHLHRSLGCPIQ